MNSRRSVLGTIGAGIALGTAGCLGSVQAMGHEEVEDGVQQESSEGIYRGKEYVVSYDLEEKQWGSLEYNINGDYDLNLAVRPDEGDVTVALLSGSEFDREYRGRGDAQGIFATTNNFVEDADAYGESGGSGPWHLVVDNTGYFDDHTMNGTATGDLSFYIKL